jgi:hypothetical protein
LTYEQGGNSARREFDIARQAAENGHKDGNSNLETGKRGVPVSYFQFLVRLAPPRSSFFFPEAAGYANFNGHVGAST